MDPILILLYVAIWIGLKRGCTKVMTLSLLADGEVPSDINPDKEIILIIFLPINLNMCYGCSKEPSHRDGSFEYTQHMFWMRNKENNFPICSLIWRPDQIACILAPNCLTLSD